jgi:hypothetical protein
MAREISHHDLKSLRRVVSTTSLPTGECKGNFSSTNNITTLKQYSLNVPTNASWFCISLVRSQPLLSQFHPTQLIIKTVTVMMAIRREDRLL